MSSGFRSSYFYGTDGTFLFRPGSGSGVTRHINLADTNTDPSAAVTTEGTGSGITWGERSDNNPYYMIRQSYRNFAGGTYTKLTLNWHTGMAFGASSSYGGMRFYNDAYPLGTTLLFHVNDTSGYIQKYVWLKTDTSGMYSDTNSAHIYPNGSASYTQWRIDGSRNSYGGIWDNYSGVNGFMYDSGGNGGVYREATGRWYFYHNVGNNSMGIGSSTTSSSYYLYVSGAIYSTGNIVAYSDARKKENVVTIDNALNKVDNLRGVYYNRIDDETKKRQVGVIAQEINEILPEVVTYAEDVDEFGVSYGNIAGLLIEAIKEQNKKMNAMQETINSLLAKLENK
jgi:hypothetical protein